MFFKELFADLSHFQLLRFDSKCYAIAIGRYDDLQRRGNGMYRTKRIGPKCRKDFRH